MAGQDDLEFKILANDESAAVVEKAAARAEALEKLDPTIDIAADDAKAASTVKSLAERVEGLTDKQKDIVLKATVAQAEEDIRRLERGLRGFKDLSDEEVQIRLVALDKATDDLEAARQLRDQLGARPAEVEITADDRASGDLDRVGDQVRDLDGEEVNVDVKASGLDGVLGKLGELDGGVGKLGQSLSALSAGGGIAAGVAGIAAALALAANASADTAISAQSLATLTGDTVEDASRLQAVWKQSGADVQDLADVALQVQGALSQTPEIAAQLGIDLRDGATGGQRLAQVLEKVRNFTGSAAEKAQLMSTVFGEEGARQAAALLSIVEDIPKALNDVDPKQVISEEDVEQARQFKVQLNQLIASFQGLATEAGQNVIPALADVLGLLNDIAGIKIGGQGIFDLGGYNAIKSALESDDITVTFDAKPLDTWVSGALEAVTVTDKAKEATVGWERAIDSLADQMDEAKRKAEELHDTQRRATDSQYAAEAATRDLAQTLLEYGQRVKDANGDQIELARINDEVRTSTIDAADAQVQAARDMATRMGITLEAKDAERIWRDSMINTTAFMTGDQRQAILDYIANVEGIPEQTVTDIQAALANGDVEEAKRLLNEAAEGPYDATIDVFVDPALANAKRVLDEVDGMVARATVQITSVLNGSQGTAPDRAAGGGTSAGSPYHYGEGDRPEVWVDAFGRTYVLPGRNGSVRPLEQTAATSTAGGSSTTIINYPPGVGARDVSRAQRAARRRGFGRVTS